MASPAGHSYFPHMSDLLARYAAFVDDVLLPIEPLALSHPWPAIAPQLDAARQVARDRALWAAHLPREWGGLGVPLAEFAEISAILGRTITGHYACNVQAPDVGNMELLLAHGSAEQKERFLRPLAAGTIRSCFGMTEPARGAGRDRFRYRPVAGSRRCFAQYLVSRHDEAQCKDRIRHPSRNGDPEPRI